MGGGWGEGGNGDSFKSVLPRWPNSFLLAFRVDPFSEGACCAGKKQEVTKVAPTPLLNLL